MRAALYARVSTEGQQARGTIGSQLAVLRERVAAEGDDLVAEFTDDGCSGARLDRPGLDALRDAAEAGLFARVWCLSPDRLARVYAYQVVVLDELARLRVKVCFTDAPPITDDPQATLLTQIQGVIAEYERAKIAERYRRGKLFRSRAGEVLSWRAPYGYRRIPRDHELPAHLEVFEPEAAVVRRIFRDYTERGLSMRQIARGLAADQVPTPRSGNGTWGTSTLGRLLHNEAYIGRVYFNRTEAVPNPKPGHRHRQIPRPREEWIAIAVPAIVSEETFAAVSRVTYDNSQWSPRRTEPGQWLLRGLVKCGSCHVGTNCHKMRGRNGTWHRYYHCRNHDPIRAGGSDRRCPERNIRADALDAFVFSEVRQALLRPDVLLAGEQATAERAGNAELLDRELAGLDRKLTAAQAERGRLADLYQAALIDLPELQRRATGLEHRRSDLARRRGELTARRHELAQAGQLQHRLDDFAQRVLAGLDALDFEQQQALLRLAVEEIEVSGWQVKIRLRIPLDEPPAEPTRPETSPLRPTPSSEDRLRSVGGVDLGVVDEPVDHGGGDGLVAEGLSPPSEGLVRGDDHAGSLVSVRDELEEQVRRLRLERDVADLVDHDQRVAAELDQLLLEPAGLVGCGEAVDPLGGGGERDPVAGLAGPHREAGGQVRLAGAWRPQKNGVLPGRYEVQCSQVTELLARHAPQMGDIEFLDGLDRGEAGGADAALAAVAVTGGDLALQAGDQVLGVGPGLGAGALRQALGGVQQRGSLHRAGEERQVGGGLPAGVGRLSVRLRRAGRSVRSSAGHQVSSLPAPPSMRVNMRS
ncbi:DNA invertase Pin-like site-specific DNA recombinase [Streptomyces sp. TLI_235]|nr:DNA invertase Pin-like site-specific DNA recombinase [Streptomyces sp. TLI_235]